ncbi:hypothetical protein SmJEL517_g00234 [Synchytrium microbalum]|uniref:ELMO domain-containing protein n=1 Tax=Synchytrium microbalum TaxID=1806994 RepID=A0A507C8S5_9FUNG|nr:uncharacterized protein SmJEL517_g00234 [Synchytrium microbalum]TPX37990.1 hypothetical protein SmJEL517_g00234 [Synchytrium microbalum]
MFASKWHYTFFGLDTFNSIATAIISQIYGIYFLLRIHKLAKAFYRIATGTSEIYRLIDVAIANGEARTETSIPQSSGASTPTSSNDTSSATTLIPSDDGHSLHVMNSAIGRPLGVVSPKVIFRIDRAILFSNKLEMERRQLELKDGRWDLAVKGIMEKKLFPDRSNLFTPHATVLRIVVNNIGATYNLLHDLNARAATKYESNMKSSERKLLELWELLMPNERLEGRITKQWQKIGFQGSDPATDFRGMGMLGLDDLHYYAKNHPKSAARVLSSSHHDTTWFSFAIVGINITKFALTLVRTRQANHFFYSYGISKDVYQELYCYLFDGFERFWTSYSDTITVMDFSRIFDKYQARVERELWERRETVLDPNSTNLLRSKKNR